jgi:alpha-glucosidase
MRLATHCPLVAGFLICLVSSQAAAQMVSESIGPGMVRFHADTEARQQRLPSLALESPRPTLGSGPDDFPLAVQFRQVHGRVAVSVAVDEGTSLYGTGEVPGPLLRDGQRTVCWNTDAYAYGLKSESLYQSHPWVLAVRADGTSFGVLADTSYRCLVDLKGDILFVADGPRFPVIIIDRESPQAVLRGLAELTGTMEMPPLWALGYHQCRYSYTPDQRVLEVAENFRDKAIPCDVIWLDIDYMESYRSFTFSSWDFPDPRALHDKLHDQGFHTVAIIDPGIAQAPGYHVYDSGQKIDAWVRNRNNQVYTGDVWPGLCVFPDFTRADVRRWWAGLYPLFLTTGVDGIWNDMNEPAVFNVDGHTMPVHNLHRADPDLGGPASHDRYHNVYGELMARATREGVLDGRPDLRPFVLTRANFIGGHRYAATWTGDNVASWQHLDFSIPMVLNLGLSGQPFAGPDIGGFAGKGDGPMFARWMGFGALFPFARGHTGKGNIDKEPWAFDDEVEKTCRLALQGRYRLIPYMYTVFREAAETGLPIWRPLFFADPADPDLRSVDDAFLMGSDLLIQVNTSRTGQTESPLPAGDWQDITEAVYGVSDHPDLPRLLLRDGTILPLGPIVQHLDQGLARELTALVNPDSGGLAEGWFYEDDGVSFDFKSGGFRLNQWTYDSANRAVLENGTEGNWPQPDRRLPAILFGP